MSTGETPPSATARFTSPSTTTKKYPGTPKSPMLNTNNTTANVGGNRNSQARQRLIAGKISAPPPMNLPSLRREHAVGTEVPAASPATSHGWGSTSSSPSPTRSEIKSSSPPPPSSTTEKHIISPKASTHTNNHKETTTTTATAEPNVTASTKDPVSSSPVLVPSQANSTRAWAVPTVTETKAQPPSSTDFPTAAEAASTKKKPSLIDDKEYLKYASSDPNHTSWDEMVSEDLDDFSVDVVEFDDGTRVQVESDTTNTSTEPILPSDRFTDDYDRSYPPKSHHHNNDYHINTSGYKPYRRSEDHGYNARYNYDNRRHSTEGERRYSSSDRWSGNSREAGGYSHRRPSYDRKPDQIFHPTTLLQRPRRLSEQSLRSDHSQEHTNPLQIIPEPAATEEITLAQKNLMLTAAERAKKRLDEQEAEYKAAAERARQKAAALAEQQKLKEPETAVSEEVEKKILTKAKSRNEKKGSVETKRNSLVEKPNPTKTKTESAPKVPDTSKPWNLVAAKSTNSEQKSTSSKKEAESISTTKEESPTMTAPSPVAEPSTVNVPKVIEKDQQSWDNYVTQVRNDKDITTETVTSNDWSSFATRLQESEVELASAAKQKSKAIETDLPQKAPKHQQEQQVEVLDYAQNEEWGTIPAHLMNGRAPDRSGWTRNKGEYRTRSNSRGGGNRGGRTKGGNRLNGFTKSTDHWRSEEEHQQPNIVEILKHEPKKIVEQEIQPKQVQEEEETVVVSKKTRLANLLKESTSSIFPEYIEKLAGKKPANMSFMVDVDESDRDITMMDVVVEKEETKTEEEVKEEEEHEVESEKESSSVPSAVLDETTSATSSTASTPPRSQFEQNGLAHQANSPRTRMNANPNFPVLVYQYPVNQQQTEEVGPLPNGYHNRSKGMQQQRPMGVYLMPQQQYMTSNQYMVPYPQAGTGNVKPVYYPALPWQQQQQQQQPQQHYSNSTSSSPRPAYEQRRPFNNNQQFNTNGYQNHRYGNNYPQQQRGTYRKRGQANSSWSGIGRGRGNGFNNNSSVYHGKRYNNNHHHEDNSPPTTTFEAEPSAVL